VMTYNNKIQSIPSNIIASVFDFSQAEYFEAGEESRAVPRADLR
jgi:LemA protein